MSTDSVNRRGAEKNRKFAFSTGTSTSNHGLYPISLLNKTNQKREQALRQKKTTQKISLENPGIDPGTSRMLSERSTMWANSPCTQWPWQLNFLQATFFFLKNISVQNFETRPWVGRRSRYLAGLTGLLVVSGSAARTTNLACRSKENPFTFNECEVRCQRKKSKQRAVCGVHGEKKHTSKLAISSRGDSQKRFFFYE